MSSALICLTLRLQRSHIGLDSTSADFLPMRVIGPRCSSLRNLSARQETNCNYAGMTGCRGIVARNRSWTTLLKGRRSQQLLTKLSCKVQIAHSSTASESGRRLRISNIVGRSRGTPRQTVAIALTMQATCMIESTIAATICARCSDACNDARQQSLDVGAIGYIVRRLRGIASLRATSGRKLREPRPHFFSNTHAAPSAPPPAAPRGQSAPRARAASPPAARAPS